MSLQEKWNELVEKDRSQIEANKFWTEYFAVEKAAYEKILENDMKKIHGQLKEVAEQFDMDPVIFTGFIDGINTSLVEPVNMEGLEEESEITLEIDYEKLYYNMLDNKADWLYNLPQWDNILPLERRKQIKKEYNASRIAVSNKIGRNDPCPCGSGKKYKKCCGA